MHPQQGSFLEQLNKENVDKEGKKGKNSKVHTKLLSDPQIRSVLQHILTHYRMVVAYRLRDTHFLRRLFHSNGIFFFLEQQVQFVLVVQSSYFARENFQEVVKERCR